MFAFRWLRRHQSDPHHPSLARRHEGGACLRLRHFVRWTDQICRELKQHNFSYMNGAGVLPSLLFWSTFSLIPPSLIIITPVNHSTFCAASGTVDFFFRRFQFFSISMFLYYRLRVILFVCICIPCPVLLCNAITAVHSRLSSFPHSSRNLHNRTPPSLGHTASFIYM